MAEKQDPQAAAAAQSYRGTDKVAALLLAMGKPLAARLLKHFDEEEIRLVAGSASNLGIVPRAVLDELIKEFAVKVATEGGIRGNFGEAEELLLGVIPDDRVRQIMSDVRSKINEAVWPRLTDLPPNILAQYVGKEHPQVAAFILSKTPAAAAAAIISNLPAGTRNELMRRLLSMKIVLEPALRVLEGTLRDELLQKISSSSGSNIHAKAADIINKLEGSEMQEILESLSHYKPREAKIVRGLLFTFEDIAKLTEASRVSLFAEIPSDRIIAALKGTEPGLRELILNAIPTRTRRIIEQDLASGVAPTQKETQTARRSIADLALEMAERGLIELVSDAEA